jgi:hypothetical protein
MNTRRAPLSPEEHHHAIANTHRLLTEANTLLTEVRDILDEIRDALVDNPDKVPTPHPMRCGASVWPYTKNNVCILKPHKTGNHQDARGREFTAANYIEKEGKS